MYQYVVIPLILLIFKIFLNSTHKHAIRLTSTRPEDMIHPTAMKAQYVWIDF